MENKHILIIVAVIGTVLFSYPSTLALFANDHAFYNGSSPCTKCHEDIQIQLEVIGQLNTIHRTLDEESGCRACHANQNNTFRNITQDYHAAYNPECIECHSNVSSIYGLQESHEVIVTGAATSTFTSGINEACMMCHTTLYTSVTVRNRLVFAFENDSVAVNNTPIYDGTYTTTFLIPPPTGSHNFVSDVQCIACHMPVYELMNQTGKPYNNHKRFGCDGCHRGSGTSEHTEEVQITYHAAKTKHCSDCHVIDHHSDNPSGKCMRCHDHHGEPWDGRDCNRCHDSHGGIKI